jgi:signal transduction histidine kinase
MTMSATEQQTRAALLDSQRRVLERIANGAPLGEILETLVRLIEAQADGMRCAVLLLDAQQQRLRFAAAPSLPEDFKAAMNPFLSIAPAMTSCATAVLLRKPVYTQDTRTDPLWKDLRDLALRNGMRAIWSTPILSDDNAVLGTFAMYYGVPQLPSPEHIQLIDMATQMARVAIEAKGAGDALRRSAAELQALSRRLVELQESERRELSRELHDRIGQNLTALTINLDILKKALASHSKEVDLRLEDSAALLESTMDAIENVMSELRPPMLDEHGLAAALDWHARSFSSRTGIAVEVRSSGPAVRLAPEVEIALFRIAQEALNNVAKHARARRIEIAIEHANGECVMSVQDDGIGFDSVDDSLGKPRSGLGMVTMRERSQAVGGRFEVRATPGRGTQLTVRMPC